NTIIHLIQVSLTAATIGLCSRSLSIDNEISKRVWSFLISQSSIILAVSLLFLFKIMDFEHNNGIFYCLASCGLTISAMGVCIGILQTRNCGMDIDSCRIRRAITALICTSTFIWVIILVQFLIVFYVSRLGKDKFLPSAFPDETFQRNPN
ncbi:uncharacterized protein ASCRUDRAFT_18835, partial [Ascoidea rubescens DSM 1968]